MTLRILMKKAIAENFNTFFTELGPKLSSKIPHLLINFEHSLQRDYTSLVEKSMIHDELSQAPQTLKTKKSSRYDETISHDQFLSL